MFYCCDRSITPGLRWGKSRPGPLSLLFIPQSQPGHEQGFAWLYVSPAPFACTGQGWQQAWGCPWKSLLLPACIPGCPRSCCLQSGQEEAVLLASRS